MVLQAVEYLLPRPFTHLSSPPNFCCTFNALPPSLSFTPAGRSERFAEFSTYCYYCSPKKKNQKNNPSYCRALQPIIELWESASLLLIAVCVLFYWQIYMWEGLRLWFTACAAPQRWPVWLIPLAVCVAGDRAVWPPAQRPAEALSAALPVLQPPPPDQGAVPLPHLGLLQQRAQQGDPAAGDELRAAGDLHPGKRQD